MIRMILAAAAAFALVSAAPAFACPDCHDCPNHKAASAEKTEKKDTAKDKKMAGCACAKDGAACKGGEACKCPNCPEHAKAEKKDEKKS
jgi:hypothetical protein